MSNVPEASTPGLGGTSKPTTDHARIKTVLRSYEVVGDGYALIQKVSGVSTTFQFLAIDPCLDPSRQKLVIYWGCESNVRHGSIFLDQAC